MTISSNWPFGAYSYFGIGLCFLLRVSTCWPGLTLTDWVLVLHWTSPIFRSLCSTTQRGSLQAVAGLTSTRGVAGLTSTRGARPSAHSSFPKLSWSSSGRSISTCCALSESVSPSPNQAHRCSSRRRPGWWWVDRFAQWVWQWLMIAAFPAIGPYLHLCGWNWSRVGLFRPKSATLIYSWSSRWCPQASQ